MEPPSRFKVPAGSLLIDGALVMALIWSQATMQETMRSFDLRLNEVKLTTDGHSRYEARLSVVETSIDAQGRSLEALKQDIVKRLDRIEAKLDRIR